MPEEEQVSSPTHDSTGQETEVRGESEMNAEAGALHPWWALQAQELDPAVDSLWALRRCSMTSSPVLTSLPNPLPLLWVGSVTCLQQQNVAKVTGCTQVCAHAYVTYHFSAPLARKHSLADCEKPAVSLTMERDLRAHSNQEPAGTRALRLAAHKELNVANNRVSLGLTFTSLRF